MKRKIRIRKYLLLLTLLATGMHKNVAQTSRNGLRQKELLFNDSGITNNCDDKIFAITEIGHLFEIEKIENKENIIKQYGVVLPFKCNAIVKSLNNIIYAAKAYEQSRTAVYEYNPVSMKGGFTNWILPPNKDGGWVSGAVDSKGRLYFMSTRMENLVRIDLHKGEMKNLWIDNMVVQGWEKENCTQGCNFYINQQDELVVKENRGSGIWHISINNGYRVVKVELVNVASETNPTSDIMEYINASNVRMNLLLGRNTIFNYSKIKNESIPLVKIDTLKAGILTEFAGCNNFAKSEERIIEDEKDELITFSTNINESIRLKNIIFKLGESELQPASFLELDRLVKQLKKYRQVEIMLEGHTDISGDAEENIKLSLERVNSCKKYLVNKGIEARRIQITGLGSSRPLKRSGSEKEREINRRVEFKIIKGIG